MRAGADVIYQGAFVRDGWRGLSDFLLRVERPSALGVWSYEVLDTKVARTAKPSHILQLCFYADEIAVIQGLPAPGEPSASDPVDVALPPEAGVVLFEPRVPEVLLERPVRFDVAIGHRQADHEVDVGRADMCACAFGKLVDQVAGSQSADEGDPVASRV